MTLRGPSWSGPLSWGMVRLHPCALFFLGCAALAVGCVPPSWTCASNADCNVGSSCVDGACEPAPFVDGGGADDAGTAVDAGVDGGSAEAVDRDPADAGVPAEGEGEGEAPLDNGRD